MSRAPETSTPPGLLAVRRWTRARVRARRRATRSVSRDLGDLYNTLLGVVIAATLLIHAVDSSWGVGRVGICGQGEPCGRAEPVMASLGLFLALAAAALGALRRLGPVYLTAEQQAWWLPLPGARGRLVRHSARLVLLGHALMAAGLGAGSAILLGARWPAVLIAIALLASAALVVGLLLLRAQFRGKPVSGLRLILLVLAVLLLAAASGLPQGPSPECAGTALSLGLASAAIVLWRRLIPMLEDIPERQLRITARRRASLRGAGLAMDTRGLAMALAPEPRLPCAASRAPLSALGAVAARRPGSQGRTLLGVAHVDALLLARQPWRLLILLVLAAAAMCSQMILPTRTALLSGLSMAWCACLISGDAARRAQRDPGPDDLWPGSPLWVRVGHLVVPSLIMTGWWLIVGAPSLLLGYSGSASMALGLLSAPGWAGAALRSGFRADADWSMIVPTPVGAVPAGLMQTVATGPDVAVLVAAPIILAQRTSTFSLGLLALQLVLDVLVIGSGLRTGKAG
ncbi:DUF6297 family protein [Actinomyces oricola]